jgi:hypothetical protein
MGFRPHVSMCQCRQPNSHTFHDARGFRNVACGLVGQAPRHAHRSGHVSMPLHLEDPKAARRFDAPSSCTISDQRSDGAVAADAVVGDRGMLAVAGTMAASRSLRAAGRPPERSIGVRSASASKFCDRPRRKPHG